MPKIGEYNATQKQVDVLNESMEAAEELFKKIVDIGLKARAATVSLPHINEDGESVQHGSNVQMSNIKKIHLQAAQALVQMFPRELNKGEEYFPYMVLRNQGTLPDWMAKLIENNGGEIPTEWSYSDTSI